MNSLPSQQVKRALSIAETCEALSISRATLHRQVREGAIRTVAIGRRRIVPADEINRLLAGEPRL